MVVNTKVVPLHLVLDEVVLVDQVWFRIWEIKRCKVGKKLKMGHMTIIICELNLRFSLIWFLFLWCICVCLSYISILQAIDQAMVALIEDLQIWLSVCEWTLGIFSLFDFSLFDLIFLGSKVILISLETFLKHWNHSKRSSSKICKNGHKHIRGDMSIFLNLVICSPCFTWAWVRVNLVLDLV